MLIDFRTLNADEPLEGALFQAEPGRTLMPVLRDDRLIGLLSAENVGELMMIRSARALLASVAPPLPPSHRGDFATKR